MYGVPGLFNKRALTHQVSITGLHPLDRYDEGMKGPMDPLRHGRVNLQGRRGECTSYGKIWSFMLLLYFTMHPRSYYDLNSLPFNRSLSIKGYEILRISEYLRENRIKLRELNKDNGKMM
jgi:hypothetical protein